MGLMTSALLGSDVNSVRKTISALLTMPKPLTVVDHNKLWKILKQMGIPDHLTCLLRNLYVRSEATESDMKLVQNWERST